MKRDVLTKLDRQRLGSLPAGSLVRFQPAFHVFRALATRPDGTKIAIQNCIVNQSVWLAAARREFPQLTYREVAK